MRQVGQLPRINALRRLLTRAETDVLGDSHNRIKTFGVLLGVTDRIL